MTMLLDGRLRDLATQTHLLETKVSSLGWMAGAGAQTLKSMTRAQAHLMLAECDLLDALEANEKKEKKTMSDYKQRMIREHRELQERISKLAHMLEGYAEGTLDFTPACSFQLLESQLYAMGTYANILQERARIEQVDLNAPLEGGESGEVSQD